MTDAVFNIAGAAWATNINFAVATLLNLAVLQRYGISFPWKQIGKIICAALLMGVTAYYLHGFLLAVLPLKALTAILTIMAAAIIYAVLLPVLGIADKKELRQLPVIRKFLK